MAPWHCTPWPHDHMALHHIAPTHSFWIILYGLMALHLLAPCHCTPCPMSPWPHGPMALYPMASYPHGHMAPRPHGLFGSLLFVDPPMATHGTPGFDACLCNIFFFASVQFDFFCILAVYFFCCLAVSFFLLLYS
jgi:hypothetical protein